MFVSFLGFGLYDIFITRINIEVVDISYYVMDPIYDYASYFFSYFPLSHYVFGLFQFSELQCESGNFWTLGVFSNKMASC